MTAEQVTETVAKASRPRLRLVQVPVARVSTIGFVAIVLLLIAAGLTGVMLVSTTVNAQSRELAGLRQEAMVLGYEADGLESKYQRVTSTNALALRAAELGLVPNPYPAFVNLGKGTITGEPKAVTGKEMPFLQGSAPEPEPSPGAAPSPSASQSPSDLAASGGTGEQR